MNPWKRPTLINHEKYQLKNASPPEIDTPRQQININHQPKCRIPEGKTSRQIDYMLINHRYRNAIRKAQATPGWQANRAQRKQHIVIHMDICIKLMKQYKKGNPEETGKHILYDIQDLRRDPRKITRWIEQREEPPGDNKNGPTGTTEQIWGKSNTQYTKDYKYDTP